MLQAKVYDNKSLYRIEQLFGCHSGTDDAVIEIKVIARNAGIADKFGVVIAEQFFVCNTVLLNGTQFECFAERSGEVYVRLLFQHVWSVTNQGIVLYGVFYG